MNAFFKRTLFGFIYVVIFIGSLWLDSWAFFAVLLFVVAVGADELCRLLIPGTKLKRRLLYDAIPALSFILLGTAICCTGSGGPDDIFVATQAAVVSAAVPVIFIVSVCPFFFSLFSKDLSFSGISSYIWTSAILICNSAVMMLVFSLDSGTTILFTLIFALISINDTFAYLVGSTIGKHKLFERISPAKTIEGSLGGLVFTVLTAYLCNRFWLNIFSDVKMIGLALIIVVFGSLGDLIESMLKRQAGVKDSGNIIPGHGGILDRFDALLFAMPFVFIYSILMAI